MTLSAENKATYLRVMGADHLVERGHPDEWGNLNRLLDAVRAEGSAPPPPPTGGAGKLVAALKELLPAVDAYLMSGDPMTSRLKRHVWSPALRRAREALASAEAASAKRTDSAQATDEPSTSNSEA